MAGHIEYPKIPLQGLLEVNAQKVSGDCAIIFGNRRIPYLELDKVCNRFANALQGLGATKGDRVVLYLPNSPQFVIAYFGVLKAGMVVTAISPLQHKREIQHQLGESEAKIIVTVDTLYPIVETVWEKTQLRHAIVIAEESETMRVGRESVETVDFGVFMNSAADSVPDIDVDPETDLAALQFTGNTTSAAKAVMLTHHNLVSNALAFAAAIEATGQDVFLSALPLFHIYGMTTSLTVPISLGAKIVLLPKFESTKACEAIQQHRVTVFCGVPAMYQMLLADCTFADYDLASMRVCISGASSLPLQVQKRFMEVTGGVLVQGYGLTEASPVTHCMPIDRTGVLRAGSIGQPLADTEAKIVDLETGKKPLAKGEIGELSVRGPQVMAGYWHRPDETACVLCDGWLLTGDIAYVDKDGYFYIVDRKKDLIKHKGYSIYPRELEDILHEHPAVKLCAVAGVADAALGEVPKAYVVLKDAVYVSKLELKEFVNHQVAGYKAIKEIEFLEYLPLSSTGKVLKRFLNLSTNI
ncbi:MAG: long-chain fatty acid--CoA ligase [Nitrososphaerota archaeon]|jgi:long-chain acyl-CoA synthetase|uniref:long-chain-fatty-acid--CoA ligase n=1 Tax=Candidatus Bathycorpusculum sp. TaxID=2994959 RepID=UPI002837D30B|nr:long-chain fatty acid--CoA ligase [Candidatus Termitimicrobium sp.]MCL2432569.1 long-chain fatty acid--CoA ligase [Candidatus Termitimicrobium sp.]MDR0493030.1 long-chain fatty acid--CoA ligase [Nitrososphaerota archaeon]